MQTVPCGASGRAKNETAVEAVAMPGGKPTSVEVLDTAEGRFVVATYADGSIIRKLVDPDQRPRRKPRKPIARVRTASWDKTRKKQI